LCSINKLTQTLQSAQPDMGENAIISGLGSKTSSTFGLRRTTACGCLDNFRKLFSIPLRTIKMNKTLVLAAVIAAAALAACGKKEEAAAPAAPAAAPAAAAPAADASAAPAAAPAADASAAPAAK
jgi:hypothetical protein